MKNFTAIVTVEFPDDFELPEVVKKEFENKNVKNYMRLAQFLQACVTYNYGNGVGDITELPGFFEGKERYCKQYSFYCPGDTDMKKPETFKCSFCEQDISTDHLKIFQCDMNGQFYMGTDEDPYMKSIKYCPVCGKDLHKFYPRYCKVIGF